MTPPALPFKPMALALEATLVVHDSKRQPQVLAGDEHVRIVTPRNGRAATQMTVCAEAAAAGEAGAAL